MKNDNKSLLLIAVVLLVGSRFRLNMKLLTSVTLVCTSAAIVLISLFLLAGLKFTGYKPNSYGYMVLLALFRQLIGHSSFSWALKYLNTCRTGGGLTT